MTKHFLRFIALILVLCVGCKTNSKIAQKNKIGENNKDVIALSYLIRDYMRQTNNTNFSLSDITKHDSSGRITNNFSKLEVSDWPDIWRGGYAVYFKFSDKRSNDSITLKETESIPWKMKTKDKIGKSNEQLSKGFDGEIHFYYPERFYYIVEIVMRR